MGNRTLTECWLQGVHDKTRCQGATARWVLMRDADARRAVQVVVCDKHAGMYSFSQVVSVSVGAPRPSASTPRRITPLRTAPETAPLKIKRPQG